MYEIRGQVGGEGFIKEQDLKKTWSYRRGFTKVGRSLERTKVVKTFTANINISVGLNWSEKKDLDQRGTYALSEIWIKHFRTFDCVVRSFGEDCLEKDCGWWVNEILTDRAKVFYQGQVQGCLLRIAMDFALENFWSAVIYHVVMRCKTHVASSSFQHHDTVLDVQLAQTLFTNLICFCK